MRVFSGIAAGMMISGVVMGQVVGPIPEAAPGLEKGWTPPAPPPKAPVPAPLPEIQPVDLVVKGPDGKIVLEKTPIEIKAAKALLQGDAEKMALLEAKLHDRAAIVGAALVKGASEALQTRAEVAAFNENTDWNGLLKYATIIGKFSPTPALEQYLLTSGIFQQNVATAFSKSCANWHAARSKAIESLPQNEVLKVRVPEAIRERVVEQFYELDRLLLAIANDWKNAKAKLEISGDAIAAGEKQLAAANNDQAKMDAAAAILTALPAEKQSAALALYAVPLPAGMAVPAKVETTITNQPGGAAVAPEKK